MQILSTKLFFPALRSILVARPRLIQKLDQGQECGFVLVSAPAGYGKSTLLSAWLSHLDCPAVWYSLDDGDNDPARFLAYLSAALAKIEPSLEDALAHTNPSNPPPEVEFFLTPLVNHLTQVKTPFWLVLDDYHFIQNQFVHQVVRFLLENRPPALHLVIATRSDPPFSLSRLRAGSAMVELRMADLRFTKEEAAKFFQQTMGVKISPEDTARITDRTEGWIAGLQIAALSMQTTDDISGFITAFTGSHHPVFDYLLEEILNRQSPEIHRFLLKTSILEKFTPPLCDALNKGDDKSLPVRSSSVILDELEHGNLFIIPLDPQRCWYRYHPLFADLLRGYLHQHYPEWIPVLHTLASSWFEEQGLIPDAIRHALAAGEGERVIRLISSNVFALLEQSELASLARQLEKITYENSPARPWLWIGRAWLSAYTGQLRSVEHYLELVESEISSINPEMPRQKLTGHTAAIRAFAAWMEGKGKTAARAAQEALECLPEEDYLLRCLSATLLGLSYDDLNLRAPALEQALVYSQQTSVSHVTIFTHGCWAFLLFLQGKLRKAYAACHEAIRLADLSHTSQPLPTLSHIYGTLSLILCEWNDLGNSLFYAREALKLARRWGQADALHFAYTNLGSALFAAGDVDDAFDIIHQARQLAKNTSAWFEEITIAQEVDWHLAQGNLEDALKCLRHAQIDIEDRSRAFLSISMPIAHAQIFLTQKQYSKAVMVIASSIDFLEKRDVNYLLVRALNCQALIYHGMGQTAKALLSFKRALTLAATEGYGRTFCASDNALGPLLYQARAAGICPEYVDKLLASMDCMVSPRPAGDAAASRLFEPLSTREMDVLKLLVQGYSDKKIAEALVIAPETVHKHLKNIYGKLDVHSRAQAVARSRELRLL